MPKRNTTKDKVIALYETGEFSQLDLARKFKVSPQAIHHLLHAYAPKSLMKKIKALKLSRAEEKHKIRSYGSLENWKLRHGKMALVKQGKRWATLFTACVDCGTSKKPHKAFGRCDRCYQQLD